MEGLPHRTCFGNDVTAPFVREERRGENAGRLLVNGHDSDFDDDYSGLFMGCGFWCCMTFLRFGEKISLEN